MPMHPHPTSFGVFKPVNHVLMSFATVAQSDDAARALRDAGFSESDISRYTPGEMQAQAEEDIRNASALASLGQDLNLVKAHLALALQGQSFVIVSAAHNEQVQRATEVAKRTRASLAQHYGLLVIEELVPPGTSTHQTTESPDRGLDMQTVPREDVLGPEADA
jgi:uncharacterized protein YukE